MEEKVHRAEKTIPSDLAALEDVRSFVRGFCEANRRPCLGEELVSRLELAVNEAVTNVIKHAYEGRSGESIHLVAESGEARLTIHVCHRGKAFDPEDVPAPAFDGSRDGGFGLFIIRQCVDEFSLHVDEKGRNCMRLVTNLSCFEKGGSDGGPG